MSVLLWLGQQPLLLIRAPDRCSWVDAISQERHTGTNSVLASPFARDCGRAPSSRQILVHRSREDGPAVRLHSPSTQI